MTHRRLKPIYWRRRFVAALVFMAVVAPTLAISTANYIDYIMSAEPTKAASYVSSGLQLAVDAADTASYSGSGSTWTDISGNGKNGTLATFGSGSLTISSSTSSAPRMLTNNSSTSGSHAKFPSGFANFTTGMTLQATVDFGNVAEDWERIIDFGTDVNGGSFVHGDADNSQNIIFGRAGTSSDLILQIYAARGSGMIGECKANGAISSDARNYAVTLVSSGVNTTTCIFYKNGVQLATSVNTITRTPDNATRDANFMGLSNWTADADTVGGLKSLLIYNRALNSGEIQANYDADRIPLAPTALAGTPTTATSVALSWTAPTSSGWSSITDYVVEYSTDNSTWNTFADGASTATTATVTGLAAGTTYYFRVSASNSSMSGAASSSAQASTLIGCTATGPTDVTIGGIAYRYIRYTTPDTNSADGTFNGDGTCGNTWTVPTGVTSADVLVVAGGGGGGFTISGGSSYPGGGGGGGGVIYDTIAVTAGSGIAVAVGKGGAGGTTSDNTAPNGANSVFGSLTAIGGGGGGKKDQAGASGGSGGGGGAGSATGTSAGGQSCTNATISYAGGAGTATQGNDASFRGCWGWGGSGGGAGSASYIGGVGATRPGFPLAVSITGTQLKVGAGGSGDGYSASGDPAANSGGGGQHTYGGANGNGRAGASGTVIVRWAVSAEDGLPNIGLFARYRAGDYDATNKVWADSSGNGRHVNSVTGNVTGTPTLTMSGATGNGNSVAFPVLSGGASSPSVATDSIRFPTSVLPNDYTLQTIGRYATGAVEMQRIFNSPDSVNWLSGFWGGMSGVAYHGPTPSSTNWITQYSASAHGLNWVLGSDHQKTASANAKYRSQGVDRTVGNNGYQYSDAPRLAINDGSYAEYSDWEVADILVYGSTLTSAQLRQNELYLNRLYGIETPGLQATGVSAAKVASSSTSLSVSWTRASDDSPTAQTLQQSTDGTTWSTATTSASVTGTSTSATVTGLTGGTNYYFRILTDLTTVTNEVPSAKSTAVAPYVATTTALTNSASPTEGQAATLTATVSPAPAGGTAAFTAGGTTITGCGSTTLTAGVATCSWTPSAPGAISVVATYTPDSASLGSTDTESITVGAAVPGTINDLAAAARGPGRLDLTWSPPSGSVTDYVVEYALAGSGSWTTFPDSVSSSTGIMITGLADDTRYDTRVTAKNGSLAGLPSNTATAWTQIEVIASFTTPGTYTWTAGPDVDLVELLIVGGGGGGAAGRALNSSNWYGGGGGEGGAYSLSSRSVTPGGTYTVVVGAGGAAGTSNGTNGSAGGASSFGGVVSAAGGAAGQASTTLNVGGAGGTGGNGGDGGDGADGGSGGSHQTGTTPGNGGSGNNVTLRGNSYCVGGGGGGGQRGSEDSRWSFAGTGGACGSTRSGGTGNYYDHASTRTYIAPQAGVDGTGGGGGGGAYTSGGTRGGAAGGSGRVTIVRSVPLLITSSAPAGAATYASSFTTSTPTIRGRQTPIVWSAAGLPAWAAVNSSTGVVTGTPNAIGTSAITLTATDANGDTDSLSFTITSSKASQSLSFAYSGNKTYGDADFSVQATATSGLVTAFSTDTPTVCTVTGDSSPIGNVTGAVVSVLKAGTCNLTAAQAGNSGWNPATSVTQSFTVAAATQSALTLVASTSVTFGDTVTLGTSGGSGSGAVSYSLVGGAGTAQSTITSGVVSFGSAGTCVVRATKAADDRYSAVSATDKTITVAKASQSVAFTSNVPTTPVAGGSYTLTATSTASLTVSFSVITGSPTVCTLSAGVVSFVTSGRCEVAADQAGNGSYEAATRVTQVISVGQRNQNITFAQPVDMEFGDADVSLGITASSNLTVTVVSETTGICTVTGDIVSIVAVGECSIKASQPGNTTWAAASDVTRKFDVRASLPTAPSITSMSAANASITIGFTAPSFTGGTTIVGYRVVVTPTGGTAATFDTCTTSPCTIDGLTNGTEYTATVAARNVAGAGPASNASPAATPVSKATAPTAIAAVPGPSSLAVTWTEPETLGGGTFVEYQLRIRVKGQDWSAAASATITSLSTVSHTFTGLANGIEYEVQIVTITTANATAVVGNTGEMSAVPMTTPSAPRDLTIASNGTGVIRVAWSEPLRDGGAGVTSYNVTIDNAVTCGTITISATTRAGSCDATNLVAGKKYTVTVKALNRIGAGDPATETYNAPVVASAALVELPKGAETRTTPKKTTAGTTAKPKSGTAVAIAADGTKVAPRTSVRDGKISANLGKAAVTLTGAPGSGVYTNSSGQLVVEIPGRVLVSGKGLKPGARATVWLMSTPRLLGYATVGDDGTVRKSFTIPANLAAGQHTIQVESLNAAGAEVNLAFGISATRSAVPVTGDDPWAPVAWSLILIALGATFLLVIRRSRSRVA